MEGKWEINDILLGKKMMSVHVGVGVYFQPKIKHIYGRDLASISSSITGKQM